MNESDHSQIPAMRSAGVCRPRASMSNVRDKGHFPASVVQTISLELLTLVAALGEDAPQVHDFSLTCAATDVLRVSGLTDAGRHVFLRVLNGAVPPPYGLYRLVGIDLWSLSPPQRIAARLRCTGSSLRSSRLFPHLTAQENVALSRLVNDCSSPDAMDNALDELDQLGVAHVAARTPCALSAEEHRLTSLAKAFAHRPALLLCEFPEEGLSRGAISNLRSRLWRAAHCDEACVVLFTESPALADLASTTLYVR